MQYSIQNPGKLLAMICLLLFTSCGSTKDEITYFQNLGSLSDSLWNKPSDYQHKLRPNDELLITVNAENMAAVACYNKAPITVMYNTDQRANTVPSIQAYRVDTEGMIDYPIIGRIKVEGMTTEELRDYLRNEIAKNVHNPIVTIEYTGFSISILGEVNRPGRVWLSGTRTTLLQALADANDLTIYGNRQDILLIRENNGSLERYHIDLTKADFLNSPYCYVQPNDVIYVSPNESRRANARYNSMKGYNISIISTIVGCLATFSSLAIAIWK